MLPQLPLLTDEIYAEMLNNLRAMGILAPVVPPLPYSHENRKLTLISAADIEQKMRNEYIDTLYSAGFVRSIAKLTVSNIDLSDSLELYKRAIEVNNYKLDNGLDRFMAWDGKVLDVKDFLAGSSDELKIKNNKIYLKWEGAKRWHNIARKSGKLNMDLAVRDMDCESFDRYDVTFKNYVQELTGY